MIDLLALAVPHLLMALAVIRLIQRADLDDDPALPRNHVRPDRSTAPPPGQDEPA